ncbi:MAG TPA: YggS family pyridoxal phosphate-dependent enzyme [Bacilli bacterium]|nr:YggS family pyridoxal phosphate-dependent enzyme [Bacilli bacterium]HQA55490.1 YggS family pyridoxal phosphate-dependent enzyme [Bacilli bacterium]
MIRKDIQKFLANIPKNITIVAATKYVDVSEMVYLLDNGINNFGENRVEDFLRKYEALKDHSIIWHFIGHLQRNKAHKLINKIDYLHSLDSLKLAEEIDKRRETPLPCFVEVSVNHEESKNGVLYEEALDFIKSLQQFSKIKVVGLMMMGIQGSDVTSLEQQFGKLATLRSNIEQQLHISLPYLSMGMSEDYQTALKKGATHIRLGRILFDKM